MRTLRRLLTHIGLIAFGVVMIYPLVWLFFSLFKPTMDILSSDALLPTHVTLEGYLKGWVGDGRPGFGVFILNSFYLTIPTVVLTIVSGILVGYGFSRFDFPFRKPLFAVMIGTILLPNTVLLVPRYLIFRDIGVLNSYLPFWITAAAGIPFFIFMFAQFFRGIPRSLDESALMDGCGSFRILVSILMPLLTPAIFSAAIFQSIWTWGDFFQTLIYISSVAKFPVSLGLRLSIDSMGIPPWNQIAAMSFIAMLPPIIIFFVAQRYFVEGIVTTGIKG
ncbi:MAG TPA: carbohydrate ABC transporter permease [Spirochaetia bacterium]|nr:carbohydrate ABC transporter permease [Spirochaetia bacterium]